MFQGCLDISLPILYLIYKLLVIRLSGTIRETSLQTMLSPLYSRHQVTQTFVINGYNINKPLQKMWFLDFLCTFNYKKKAYLGIFLLAFKVNKWNLDLRSFYRSMFGSSFSSHSFWQLFSSFVTLNGKHLWTAISGLYTHVLMGFSFGLQATQSPSETCPEATPALSGLSAAGHWKVNHYLSLRSHTGFLQWLL